MPRYVAAIKSALSFAIRPRSVLVYSVYNLGALAAILLPLLIVWTAGLTATIFITLAIVATVFLIGLFLDALFINSYAARQKTLGAAAKAALSRYRPVLAAGLSVAAINFVVNWILALPGGQVGALAAGIASLILTMLFLFVYQEIIVGRRNFYAGIKGSVRIFWKNPLVVIFVWIILAGMGSLLTAVFFLPVVVVAGVAFSSVVAPLTTGQVLPDASVLSTLTGALVTLSATNIAVLLATGAIAIAGLAVARLFGIGFVTDIYSQLRKR